MPGSDLRMSQGARTKEALDWQREAQVTGGPMCILHAGILVSNFVQFSDENVFQILVLKLLDFLHSFKTF